MWREYDSVRGHDPSLDRHLSRSRGAFMKRLLRLLAVVALVTGAGLTAGVPAQAAAPQYVRAACNTLSAEQRSAAIPYARCFAVGVANPALKQAAGPPSTALGPDDIRSAYQLPDAGAGMTVAIVDAFG